MSDFPAVSTLTISMHYVLDGHPDNQACARSPTRARLGSLAPQNDRTECGIIQYINLDINAQYFCTKFLQAMWNLLCWCSAAWRPQGKGSV